VEQQSNPFRRPKAAGISSPWADVVDLGLLHARSVGRLILAASAALMWVPLAELLVSPTRTLDLGLVVDLALAGVSGSAIYAVGVIGLGARLAFGSDRRQDVPKTVSGVCVVFVERLRRLSHEPIIAPWTDPPSVGLDARFARSPVLVVALAREEGRRLRLFERGLPGGLLNLSTLLPADLTVLRASTWLGRAERVRDREPVPPVEA